MLPFLPSDYLVVYFKRQGRRTVLQSLKKSKSTVNPYQKLIYLLTFVTKFRIDCTDLKVKTK